MKLILRNSVIAMVVLAVAVIGWQIARRLAAGEGDSGERGGGGRGPAPVEVGAVRRGPVELQRTFTGTLETRAAFTVAPQVGGTLAALQVDLADPVTRGAEVARVADAEFVQDVTRAEADLAEARAAVVEAESALTMVEYEMRVAEHELAVAEHERTVAEREVALAERELAIVRAEETRVGALHERGIASDSQRDAGETASLAAESAHLAANASLQRAHAACLKATTLKSKAAAAPAAAEARIAVAKARVAGAEAALSAARVRLGYTRVAATWAGPDPQRVVAERLVNEGETVRANQPLLRIVQLDPLAAVIHVPERDAASFSTGKRATFTTDAFPGETFPATVDRIAPEFDRRTRQVRIELLVENREMRLRPGMFLRLTVVLEHLDDAILVPEDALTTRQGGRGVFMVGDDGASVRWQALRTGIIDRGSVQVLAPADLTGQVVTLGQQLLKDGSEIRIHQPSDAP